MRENIEICIVRFASSRSSDNRQVLAKATRDPLASRVNLCEGEGNDFLPTIQLRTHYSSIQNRKSQHLLLRRGDQPYHHTYTHLPDNKAFKTSYPVMRYRNLLQDIHSCLSLR